MAHKDDEGQ